MTTDYFETHQLELIYKYFPSDEYCNRCFINRKYILDNTDDSDNEAYNTCVSCGISNCPPIQTVLENIFVRVYKNYGVNILNEFRKVLNPINSFDNLYDLILIKSLHQPDVVKNLLELGADPDLDFAQVTGKTNFTFLQWILMNDARTMKANTYLVSAKLLIDASKSKLILKRRNPMNRTPLGELIVDTIQSPSWSEQRMYKRNTIQSLIDWGANLSEESLNNLGISQLYYDCSYRREVIKWLVELGIHYNLDGCIRFQCSETVTAQKCSCGTEKLRHTRLGSLLLERLALLEL